MRTAQRRATWIIGVTLSAGLVPAAGLPQDAQAFFAPPHQLPFRRPPDPGAGAQSYSFPVMYNDLLGTKFKVIVGYPGPPERYLAMERGELDGACGITTSTLRAVLAEPFRDGKILLLAQAGSVKDPQFPEV